MSRLIWKELREHYKLALLVMLGLLAAELAALYQVFVSPTVGGQANVMLQHTLFGVPLGAHIASAAGPQMFVFAAMIGLLACIAYLSTRVLRAKGVVAKAVPFLTPAFAAFLPLAASLYLVTTTAWTLAQTVLLRHWIS